LFPIKKKGSVHTKEREFEGKKKGRASWSNACEGKHLFATHNDLFVFFFSF